MAKSSADDEELRRACEAAIEGTKQKIVLSIRVAKSRGIWGKSGKLGRQMAKPRVLALSSAYFFLPFLFNYVIIAFIEIHIVLVLLASALISISLYCIWFRNVECENEFHF
jgi:hypothetical protein